MLYEVACFLASKKVAWFLSRGDEGHFWFPEDIYYSATGKSAPWM